MTDLDKIVDDVVDHTQSRLDWQCECGLWVKQSYDCLCTEGRELRRNWFRASLHHAARHAAHAALDAVKAKALSWVDDHDAEYDDDYAAGGNHDDSHAHGADCTLLSLVKEIEALKGDE